MKFQLIYLKFLYKCTVTETDIPYQYQDKNLKITALMKIRRKKGISITSWKELSGFYQA